MTRASASGSALSLSWCLVVLLMMGARFAQAQMPGPREAAGAINFDMQAQSLQDALAEFGRITGHSVLVSSSLAAGRAASPVRGQLAPREALRQLLAGSGLVARYVGEQSFTLVPEFVAEASASAATRGEAVGGEDEAVADLRAYAAALQSSITRVLCIAQPDAFGRYRLGLQLWIGDDGAVREVRVLEGSGQQERDARVLRSLRDLALDAPPPALPQPLTILLTPRTDPARDCRPHRARAG
jgi:hypothetical protein